MTIPNSLVLETERLKLRIPQAEDIPHVFSASQYDGFTDGMLWEPPESEEQLIESLQNSLQAWNDGSGYAFTIEQKESGAFLGRISIRKTKEEGCWNIGFWTHPAHQGQGIMTEALQAIIDFGFTQLSAAKLEACYALWNKASEQVLRKNGMEFIRYIEKGFLKNGKWEEENLLGIERGGWAG